MAHHHSATYPRPRSTNSVDDSDRGLRRPHRHRQWADDLADEQVPLAVGDSTWSPPSPGIRCPARVKLVVTVDSGDPAYVDGYVGGVYRTNCRDLRVGQAAVRRLAADSLRAFVRPGLGLGFSGGTDPAQSDQ